MTVTREEEIVLLYALFMCGKRPSKSRATEFILHRGYLKERNGDDEAVSTGESRIENRIAWVRQNLRQKGQLDMPQRGTWAITHEGVERLKGVAIKSLSWKDNLILVDLGIEWERFTFKFLEDLKALGEIFQSEENRINPELRQ